MYRSILLAAGLVLCSASALAAEAGKVVFTVGSAQVATRAAAVDLAVNEGDELRTGADGYIYLKTVDDGFLILRPNSQARVIAYKIDAVNPANTQVKLELISGVARSISGAGVKRARNNFRFNTPVAAIGVRGTDFIVHTNAQNSWVSVVSGGVVVSGFAGACGPEGTGPCEGMASRELFAGRDDAMLQVQRGQPLPQLMQGGAVAPELNAPARSDEPVGKVGAGAKAGAPLLVDVNLDPAKPLPPVGTNAPSGNVPKPSPSPSPLPLPPIDIPNLPVIEVPVEPPQIVKSEVMWGRWQSVANNPADTAAIEQINTQGKKVQSLLGSYLIARPDNSSFVLPREGTASFALADSEAVLGASGGVMLPARVENASLSIDFGARTYSTGLSVVNSEGQLNLSSKGDITRNGGLSSGLLSQGMTVRGLLGGTNASEAVYIFKTTDNQPLSAEGITKWSRN